MAKITGYKAFEYHIPADDNGPARDFDGFKLYVSSRILPSEGGGYEVTEYRVSRQDMPYIIEGYEAKDLPTLLEREIDKLEVSVDGRRVRLVRVTFE